MAQKRKAKTKIYRQENCGCKYNEYIKSIFDESFDAELPKEDSCEEYHQALMHSKKFQDMCQASMDEDMDMSYLLSDAVRFGFEAGKRKAEIKKLEESLGI